MNAVKALATVALLTLPLTLLAGDGRLKLPDFSALAARASDHTDISLDGGLLALAGHFVDDQKPDSAQARKLLAGLKNIEIHSFEFKTDNAYSASDVEQLRRQLQAPQWKRLVQAHDAEQRSDVDVFVSMDGEQVSGLALISAEPRELTIINLVGTMDVKDLAKLGGQMGIPKQIAAAADTGTKTSVD